MTGLKIAAGVATVVGTFVAIIALINGIIGGVGGWFGFGHAWKGFGPAMLPAPLAWVMGVDWSDANLAGSLIGQKLAINDFAYLNFSPYLQTGGTLDVKPLRLFLSRCAVSLTLVLSGWWWGRFLRLRHTVPGIAQLGMRAGSGNAVKPDERHYSRILLSG